MGWLSAFQVKNSTCCGQLRCQFLGGHTPTKLIGNNIYPIMKIHLLTMRNQYAKAGLPWWLCGNQSACQCRRHRFNPWSSEIPWRRKWQLTPVFLPRKSHGQRSLVGCIPWGIKRRHTHTHTHTRVRHNLAAKQ